MTPERFRQVRNLFEAVLEKEPDERLSFVREAANGDEELHQEVLRMLDAHARKVTYLDLTLTAAPIELRTDPLRMEGRRLGHWEILSEIGRGGMGTVYLGRRADGVYEQRVAIKVVTPASGSEEVVRRFAQERSILAALEHPNIARIYDGGATEEGWPYFVMEYVNGKPIDVWCNERRLNSSERIRLLQTVCAAVHYAHRHSVIHRDLKPANIFVAEDGAVKLLDFGIANLVRTDEDEKTAMATRTGARMMTPEYASPEQIRAEETTPLTDVYSLGVILYELLTGRKPYRLKSRVLHEIARVVCEEPARRASSSVTDNYDLPSSDGTTKSIAPGFLSADREGTPVDLQRRLAGDVDSILAKVLEKKPEDRYRSAEQFSSDLERHLSGKTILATRAGRFTQLAHVLSQFKVTILALAILVLAFATGSIRVELSGLWYFAAAMLLIAAGGAITDKRIAAWLRDRMHSTDWIPYLSVFSLLCGIRLGIDAAEVRWSASRAITIPLITLALIAPFLRWSLRSRWAGDLLRGFVYPPKAQFGLLRMIAGVGFLELVNMVYTFFAGGTVKPRDWNFFPVALAAWIHLQWIHPRIEIRDRGIIYCGSLIPWLRMVSYRWEEPEDSDAGKAVLRLNVRRPLPFLLPYRQIELRKEDSDAVDDLLRRNVTQV